MDIRLKGLSINSTVEAKRRPTFMGQDSLFQAPRWWGRGESKRHAKRGAGQFYFGVCAFSIQLARISRSLEQARGRNA